MGNDHKVRGSQSMHLLSFHWGNCMMNSNCQPSLLSEGSCRASVATLLFQFLPAVRSSSQLLASDITLQPLLCPTLRSARVPMSKNPSSCVLRVLVCVHMYVATRSWYWHPLNHSPPCCLRRSLHEPGTYWFGQAGWPASPRVSPTCLFLSLLGLQARTTKHSLPLRI